MLYRNKKNGKLYEIIAEAIDATNCRSGEWVIVYQAVGEDNTYVREAEEFYEKFEPIH